MEKGKYQEYIVCSNWNHYGALTWVTNASFPPSGTGQYSTVRYGSGPNTLIQLVFPPPTVPSLLDMCGVCQRVAIDNKHNSASFMSVLMNNNSHYKSISTKYKRLIYEEIKTKANNSNVCYKVSYYGKVKNKYKVKLCAQSKRYDQEQIIDSWDHECLLNIHKTNCISC